MTEKERFADLIGTVTPLETPPRAEGFGRRTKILQRRRIEAQRVRHAADIRETLAVNLAQIPDARFRALCAGRLPLAREIDLHGFFVDEALRYLGDMLDERQNRREECWLVVHGKGRNSPHYDRAPLKQAILDLLLRHPAVNALTGVLDQDGLSGAVCIEVGIAGAKFFSCTTLAIARLRSTDQLINEVFRSNTAEIERSVNVGKGSSDSVAAVRNAGQPFFDIGDIAHPEEIAVDFDFFDIAALFDIEAEIHRALRVFVVTLAGEGWGAAIVPVPVGKAFGTDGRDLCPAVGAECVFGHIGTAVHAEDAQEQVVTKFARIQVLVGVSDVGTDVGHAAAHGFDALGFDFVGARFEGGGDSVKVGVIKDSAVCGHAAISDVHGVAGEFFAVNKQVVPAFKSGAGDAHLVQGFDDRAGKNAEIACRAVFFLDEAVGKVAEVVIDRAATRHAAHDVDAVLFDVALVHFFNGVLVTANDDGGFIDVEKQQRLVSEAVFNEIGFQRDIGARVGVFLVVHK